MSAPYFPESGTLASSLVVAVLLGTGFGFALERAGLGNARKLIGQFYGRDLSVLKVMFSALLVAMLGVFWLSRLGLLELDSVYVPETWLWPQLVGALLFGTGLAIAGLCPGTACVSAATGRLDGMVVMLGIWVGMLITGLLLPLFSGFFQISPHGAWTLPQLLDLPYGVVVAVVVVLALIAFGVAELIERRFRSCK
jgi:uncharacterized protein